MTEPFRAREADHLKPGEFVRVVAINRATGYMGTQRVQLASVNAETDSDQDDSRGLAVIVPDLALRTQVVRVGDNLTSAEHFYIHVSGTAKDESPDFDGGDLDPPYENRPNKLTPFMVPLYNEDKHWQTYNEYRRLQKEFDTSTDPNAIDPDKPHQSDYYAWNYRPEYQFSQFELELHEINRVQNAGTPEEDKTNILDLTTPTLSNTDDLIEFLYSLIGSDFERLTPIDGEQELILSLGEEETAITLGEDRTITFNNLAHLASLAPEDYLSMRLYTNNDAGNILWEYAFWFLDIDVLDDSAVRGENLVVVNADNPTVPMVVNVPGYTSLDVSKRKAIPNMIEWRVVQGSATISPPISALSEFGSANTLVTLAPVTGNKVVIEARFSGEADSAVKSVDLMVTPGKPASIELSQSGTPAIRGVGIATVQAILKDSAGNLVEDGTGVFFREHGHITLKSYEGLTRNGKVTAVVTGGATAGNYPLFARSGEVESATTISVSPLTVSVGGNASPLIIGRTYQMEAQVSGGDGSLANIFLDIGSDSGQIASRELLTDSSGKVRFEFVAPKTPGSYAIGIKADINDPVLFPILVEPPPVQHAVRVVSRNLIAGLNGSNTIAVNAPLSGQIALPAADATTLTLSGVSGETWTLSTEDNHWINRLPVYFTRFENPKWDESWAVAAEFSGLRRVPSAYAGIFGMQFAESSFWRIELEALEQIAQPAFNFWYRVDQDGTVLSIGQDDIEIEQQNGELIAKLRTSSEILTVSLPVAAGSQWSETSVGIKNGQFYLAVNDQIDSEPLPTGYTGFVSDSLRNADVEFGQGFTGAIAGLRIYDWSGPVLIQASAAQGVFDSTGTAQVQIALALQAQQSDLPVPSITVGLQANGERVPLNIVSSAAVSRFAGSYIDAMAAPDVSASEILDDVLSGGVLPDMGSAAVGMAQRFSVKPAATSSTENVLATLAWFSISPRYSVLSSKINRMQWFFASHGLDDLNIYASEYLQEAVIHAGNGNDLWTSAMVTGFTVWSELVDLRPDLALTVSQAIKNRKDFWTWVRVMSLPANGWDTDSIPVPRPTMTCDKVPYEVNIGTPLAFSAMPCRATGEQMAGFLDTFLEVAPEIADDPEILNYYVISLLQTLPTLPLEYKKLFAPIGGFQTADSINWSLISEAHAAGPAAVPVYVLRALLIIIKQGIRKAAGGAPANIIALLQGGTTSRFPPEQILGSIAYLITRMEGSTLCQDCPKLNAQVTETVQQDMAIWLAGVGMAAKGELNEEDVERRVCTLTGNVHGKANELVITAAYHSLFEFGSRFGVSNAQKYEILLSDPRTSEDEINIPVMLVEGGSKKDHGASPYQRKPDLVLAGGGDFQRIWVETKSWRYGHKPERRYLNLDDKTLSKAIFKPWNGKGNTKTYTTDAHRQHFLDYAATKKALLEDFWEDKVIKPSQHFTWFQVWEAGERRWKALVKENGKYRLDEKETVRNVATPWISENGVVTGTTPQFNALQRFLTAAPERMNASAFKTTIGYPIGEHDKNHASKQISTNLKEHTNSNIRPFTLQTFYAIEVGDNAAERIQEELKKQFGEGDFAKLQEAIENGEISKEQIDELRKNIGDEITALLGPLDALLFEIPGVSWLEDKVADMVLGDEIEALRDNFANAEIPLADSVFENLCEAP